MTALDGNTSAFATRTHENTMNLEPNPPNWPSSVMVVRQDDDLHTTQRRLEQIAQDSWSEQHQTFTTDYHWSSRRQAILFAPGLYQYKFQVGYYTQVMGLGRTMDDVRFGGNNNDNGPHIPSLNRHLHPPHGTCLDTFWRSGENFAVDGNMQWAVSQAAPLRRVHVSGDLRLHDGAAYASGGHLANAVVDGLIWAGGQQQFLFRNVRLGRGTHGGAWSMVYCGCTGHVPEPTPGSSTATSVTVVERPTVRMEKPYICLQEDGVRYELRIPEALYHDEKNDLLVGPLDNGSHERVVDFSHVRVIQPDESGHVIQAALDEGKHVVLTPGIYTLADTLQLRKPNQVLLGLGLATLKAPRTGAPCIHVAPHVPGVIVAGLMLEATERDESLPQVRFSSLLEWGDETVDDFGKPYQPGGLFDLFCRVGGSSGNRRAIHLHAMLRIHSGHVVGENCWLWVADHAELGESEQPNYPHISPVFYQSEQHDFRVETGCVVRGQDVTIFGLAVEHANGHQTLWEGERGAVYFYQCEFPYGVSSDFASSEFRGYLVYHTVQQHELIAPGIYSNFRNDPVFVTTAIQHPPSPGIRVINPFTVKLDNHGGILSVTNGLGASTETQGFPVRLM